MKNHIRAAIYARVSTARNQDVAMQLAELRELCRHRGWKVSAEFIDKGFSGAQDFRPELNRMMAEAHHRKFDVALVWKFDRFARSVSHLVRALETFRALGIEFVSLSEQIDTTTPAGKMVFIVLGAVAELERSLIGERVKAGLRNAKANGKTLGRPPLRKLGGAEIAQMQRERRLNQTSFGTLAKKYGVSVWSAFHICKRQAGAEEPPNRRISFRQSSHRGS